MFNFDEIIDRKDNFSVKWSEMDINFGSNDTITNVGSRYGF